MKKLVLATITILSTVSYAYAANLMDVYRQAMLSDAKFQSARAQFLAATEAYPQARALLLPQLSGQATESSYRTTVFGNFSQNFVSDVPGQEPAIQTTGTDKYNVGVYQLNLTQPIVNFANWAQLRIARAQVEQAAANYAAASQDLMMRTATAYFNVLQAEDTLRFTEAEKRATYRELDEAQQRYNVGLDAITSVYNARASYDAILAREISDKNAVINAREQLRQITNIYYKNLATLKTSFPLLTPQPNDVNQWVQVATQQNLSLVAANFATVAARENIQYNFANHLPTINALGNLTRQKPSENTFASPQDLQQDSVGLQLNLPIYQGGLVVSKTRQAKDQYLQAIEQREDTYRQVLVNTNQTFNDVVAGISKIEADEASILSNQSSVDSTAAALEVGTRTIVDLLNAQQSLFDAQLIFAQDRYQYLINTLTLKQLAGTLNITDLQKINTWLTPVPQKDYVADQTSANKTKTTSKVNLPTTAGSDKNSSTTTTTTAKGSANVEMDNAAKTISDDKSSANTSDQTNSSTTNTTKPDDYTNSDVNSNNSQTQTSTTKQQTNAPTNNTTSNASTNTNNGVSNNTPPVNTSSTAQKAAATSDYYVIQLLGSSNQNDLTNLIKKHNLQDTQIVSSTTTEGKQWYSLYIGHFATEQDALTAMNKLDSNLQNLHPWVRHVAGTN